jgi:hypothetical protein
MEKPEQENKKVENAYNEQERRFNDVVRYMGRGYDLRDMLPNGNAWYRMTAEHRLELPEPSYIEVDKDGNIIQEKN